MLHRKNVIAEAVRSKIDVKNCMDRLLNYLPSKNALEQVLWIASS